MSRPFLVLASVATAQLMVAVDATILSLALPSARVELALSSTQAAAVMAGYVLAAGSLMIVGGRVAQAVGFRRSMTFGLALFGVASVIGGSTDDPAVLIAARIGQGVAAAALTPAAMARLSAAFPGADRARAYGIFGIVMGSGTAIGVLLGGALTQTLGWRWCMYVNVVFVVVALALSAAAGDRTERSPGHLRGAWRGLLLTLGTGSLLIALLRIDAPTAALWLVVGMLVLVTAIALDHRTSAPLVPVELLADPTRRIAYASLFLWGIATIATFVAVAERLQVDVGLEPIPAGLLFLVYPVAIQLGLFADRRLPDRAVDISIGLGLGLIGVGQVVLAIAPDSLAGMVGALAVMGLGTSLVMPNATSAMNRNAGAHAGVAGAIGTTLQQLGGALGVAAPVALTGVGATGLTGGLLLVAALLLRPRRTRVGV